MTTLPVTYLCALYLILRKVRREGLMAIEEDVEDPEQSKIFALLPKLQSSPLHFDFMRDVLRLMVYGVLEPDLIKLYTDTAERALLKTESPDLVLFDVVRTTLLANTHGYAPQIAIEFGRQAIPFDQRPTFDEMEQQLKTLPYLTKDRDAPLPPLEQRVTAWFARMNKNDATA